MDKAIQSESGIEHGYSTLYIEYVYIAIQDSLGKLNMSIKTFD
jgi:hypothetical protein